MEGAGWIISVPFARAEVEALLKATGVDQQMKTFNLWEDFVIGKRGRAPK